MGLKQAASFSKVLLKQPALFETKTAASIVHFGGNKTSTLACGAAVVGIKDAGLLSRAGTAWKQMSAPGKLMVTGAGLASANVASDLSSTPGVDPAIARLGYGQYAYGPYAGIYGSYL